MNNSMIEFLNDHFHTHFKKKRKKRYSARSRYLRLVGIFFGCVFILFAYARFTTRTTVTYQNNSDPSITTNSRLVKISTKYNPKNELMVSHFYVGNPKNVSDVSDDSNLTNLKYSVKYKSAKGDYKHLQSRIVRVNDHYFVVETHGIKPGFLVLRYDITPHKINKTLDTTYKKGNTVWCFVDENKVKKSSGLLPASKDMYSVNYTSFVVKKYQHSIDELTKDINIARKAKKADRKLIKKLQNKMETAIPSDKDDLQDQVDETKSDIRQQDQIIRQSKRKIKKIGERIDNVQSTSGADD